MHDQEDRDRHRLDLGHRACRRQGACRGRLQCCGQFLHRHTAGPCCRQRYRRAAFGRCGLHPGRHVKGPDCRALVEKAAAKFGSVDILVNNAGIQHVAPVEEFPPEKWDAIIAINLTSAFHTTAAAIPLMTRAGWGRIVNIASAHGLVASPFKSAYVAAKHGIMGFTKTVALEVADDRHHLQCDLPGLCADAAGRSADPRPDEGTQDGPCDGDTRGHAGKQPTKEFVTVEQIAATACSCAPTLPPRSTAPTFPSMAAGPPSRARQVGAAVHQR